MPEYSDKELLDKIIQGDKKEAENAFSLLIKKYQERIYWHLRRYMHTHEETNDVAQEVWIKVWNSIKKFRGDSHFGYWIFRIATNTAISAIRKNAKMKSCDLDEYEMDLLNSETPEIDFDDKENAFNLNFKKALLKLSKKQRLIFNLVFYEEMKHKEIAEILNLSLGTIKSTYHNAVKKLRKYMSQNSTF